MMRRRHRWALTTCLLAWTGAVAGTATAASARAPLIVAVEQGSDVAPDDVRSAVAGELGQPVVGPKDPAPPDAGRIEVRSHDGVIHVAFRDARGHTIERELTAPADGATRVRMIALLAGNLARDEAADLVAHPDPPDATDAPAAAAAAPAIGGDGVSHVNVDVAPGQELRVRIAPAALQKVEEAAPASKVAIVSPPIPPSSGSEGSTQRTLGWIGIGAGAAAVGAGIALRVMAARESGSSTLAYCAGGKCAPQGIASDDAAMSKIVASNWALAVGAALGATGVILELTAPSATPSTRVGIGPTGIVLSRAW